MHGVHIVTYNLGVGGDNRAVVVVAGIGILNLLEGYAGVKNSLNSGIDKALYVPVHDFRRVARRLGRDCIDAALVDFVRAFGRESHREAELGEHCEPERVIFVHIKYARYADFAARRILGGRVAEKAVVFVFKEVRQVIFDFGVARALFAAVARDVFFAVGKGRHGQPAIIRAAAAAYHSACVGEILELVGGDERARAVCALLRDERRTERAHNPRNVGADNVLLRNKLERAQDCVIVERAAGHDDFVTHKRAVAELDNLVERVAHNRIGQPGGDIADRRALLLRLLYARVHKYRAARAEVDGAFGGECLLCEFRRGEAERLGKGLDKAAAAGGARLIEHNRVDYAVFNLHTFHILTADVDDKIHAGQEKFRRLVVGDGLDFALADVQCRHHQLLAVAGCAGIGDARGGRELFVDVF